MFSKGKADPLILLAFGLLLAVGLWALFVSSSVEGNRMHNDEYYFVKMQIKWMLVGLIAFVAFGKLNRKMLWPLGALVLLAGLVGCLLIAIFPSLRVEGGGAARWLRLGPVVVQPSEFLKVGLSLALAWWYSRKAGDVRRLWPGMAFGFLLFAVCAGAVLYQKDLGTCLVIAIIGLTAPYVAGATSRQLAAVGALVFVVGLVALQDPHRIGRVRDFLDPSRNKDSQVLQAMYSLGEGRFFGVGPGQGIGKHYIPEPHTDFILAPLAEETGLFGPGLLILLYMVMTYGGLQVAVRQPDAFGRMAATCIACYIGGQAAINIAVVTASVPCTGITLPFVSYGGSSFVTSSMAMGVLVTLSRARVRVPRERIDEGNNHGRGNRGPHIPGPLSSGRTETSSGGRPKVTVRR